MTEDESPEQFEISPDEIEHLKEQVEAFATTLPDKEATLLRAMVKLAIEMVYSQELQPGLAFASDFAMALTQGKAAHIVSHAHTTRAPHHALAAMYISEPGYVGRWSINP